MPNTCPPARCPVAFDDPRVQIVGSAFLEVQQDCNPETGILLLTDDPGLLNVSDPTLGDFLTLDLPTQLVTGLDSVLSHYSICSTVYQDLQGFFGESVRPNNIILGYVDSANETLTEAFQRITACPVCAASVQTTTFKQDGSTWIDTPEYLAFTTFIDDQSEWHHHALTYQASTAFSDVFETTSFAAQAAALGQTQEWIVADVGCRFQRDPITCAIVNDVDGNPIQEPYYLNAALTAAAFDASHSVDDANYNYTTNSEQSRGSHTGRFLDETTGTAGDLTTYDEIPLASLGENALLNLTGLANGIGAPVIGASRHLNAFLRVSDGKAQTIRYLTSIFVDGTNYGDTFYKQLVINQEVRVAALAFKDQFGTTLTAAGQQAEALVIKNVLDRWIGKGVINGDPFDWSAFNNILVNGQRGDGEGYYIGATPFDQVESAAVNSRAGSFIQYCFIVNTLQHSSILQVCEVPPIN